MQETGPLDKLTESFFNGIDFIDGKTWASFLKFEIWMCDAIDT